MKLKTDLIALIAVILIAAVVVGEYYTYAGTPDRDASASLYGDEISYSVSSDGSDEYRAVLTDTGGYASATQVYIWEDPLYDDNYSDACSAADGAEPYYMEESYYAEQILEYLEIRGFTNASVIGSDELETIVSDTSGASGIAIIVISYELPYTVYDGTDSSTILTWIQNGGTLYWMGSEIGRFYSDADGNLVEVEGNTAALFVGSEVTVNCADSDKDSYAAEGYADGEELTDALQLRTGSTCFAIGTEGLSTYLQLGYAKDGYSSITFAGVGNGYVCVIGGGFDIDQLDDLAQLIVAGITPGTELLTVEQGKVTRGTVEGTIDLTSYNYTQSQLRLYIYLGGTYANYGEAFSFE